MGLLRMPFWYPFCSRRAESVGADYRNGALGPFNTTIQFLEGFNGKIK